MKSPWVSCSRQTSVVIVVIVMSGCLPTALSCPCPVLSLMSWPVLAAYPVLSSGRPCPIHRRFVFPKITRHISGACRSWTSLPSRVPQTPSHSPSDQLCPPKRHLAAPGGPYPPPQWAADVVQEAPRDVQGKSLALATKLSFRLCLSPMHRRGMKHVRSP
jgi:hypothetical protein